MNARKQPTGPRPARSVLLTLPLAALARLAGEYERHPAGGPAAAAVVDLIRAAVVARAAARELADSPHKEAAA